VSVILGYKDVSLTNSSLIGIPTIPIDILILKANGECISAIVAHGHQMLNLLPRFNSFRILRWRSQQLAHRCGSFFGRHVDGGLPCMVIALRSHLEHLHILTSSSFAYSSSSSLPYSLCASAAACTMSWYSSSFISNILPCI